MPTYIAASPSNACSMSLPDSTTIGLSARKSAPQQSRADPASPGKNLRICKLAPFALRIALRQEQPVGRDLRPMFERLAEFVVVAPEFLRGADVDDAAGALFDRWIERRQAAPARSGGGAALLVSSRLRSALARPMFPLVARRLLARAFRENPSGVLLHRDRPAQSPTSALRPHSRLPDPFRQCAAEHA